jgi:hypothetical protein
VCRCNGFDNKAEPSMLKKYFRKLITKINKPQRQIIKRETTTNKYFDPECNLYRYSLFNCYLDELDSFYEFIEGFHTIPISEEVSFDEASSQSISFKAERDTYDKRLLKQQLLKNSQKGTRTSTSKYTYADGSLLTRLITYKDNI